MLEMLLSLSCMFGTSEGCGQSLQAYGKHTGIDKQAEEIGLKYPLLSHSMSVAMMVKEQKIMFPLIYSNLLFSSEIDHTFYVKNQVILRVGF